VAGLIIPGRGALEASVAGGDSGGPQFDQDFNLLSVTSFGITFGSNFGDVVAGLNSSFGEFGGFAPVYVNRSFIEANMVPVPGPLPLAGLPVVLGFSRRLRRRLQIRR